MKKLLLILSLAVCNPTQAISYGKIGLLGCVGIAAAAYGYVTGNKKIKTEHKVDAGILFATAITCATLLCVYLTIEQKTIGVDFSNEYVKLAMGSSITFPALNKFAFSRLLGASAMSCISGTLVGRRVANWISA